MRTPNTKCCICEELLYRRPFELAKVRYVACMEHRYEAQRQAGQTKKQKQSLMLGRENGTNHLEGMPKSKASNIKRSKSHKLWCKNNPDKVKARSKKIRGENHYLWNGGVTILNQSIRRMTENIYWQREIKERDGKCQHCESKQELEAHHIIPLVVILEKNNITNRDEARECDEMWDLKNGITLCRKCHYEVENRRYNDNDKRRAVPENA
jgi:5-methylcytosine-specific restriction endonuclease McrA